MLTLDDATRALDVIGAVSDLAAFKDELLEKNRQVRALSGNEEAVCAGVVASAFLARFCH